MKILVADDDPVSLRVLQDSLLDRGHEVIAVSDGDAAWRILQKKDGPQVACLNWILPGLEGVDICRNVRKQGREPYVYLILLTGRDGKSDIVSGFQAGADDHLRKPFDASELEARVRVGARIVGMQTKLAEARAALRTQATRDPLTELLNRGAVIDVLEKELARSRRNGNCVAVALIDMDQFKSINDTHGHAAGDAVLREAAARMRTSLRTYDTVGRYGDEEFLAVLPGCDSLAGVEGAERLRMRLSARPIDAGGGVKLTVTASMGVAAMVVTDAEDGDRVLRAADAALNRAKHGGHNRVEVATEADFADAVPSAE